MRKFYKYIYIVFIVAAVIGMGLGNRQKTAKKPADAKSAELIYSDLIAAIKSGEVEKITLKGGVAEGKFTESAAKKRELKTQDFQTRLLPTTRLFDLLEDKKVATDFAPIEEKGGLSVVRIFDILGTVLWIGILIMWFRSMRGGGMSLGGLGAGQGGNGHGRAFVVGDTKIRFKDVLGIDEAKKEVSEIVDYLEDSDKYTRIGAKIPKGVLLVGPPGTGKTLLAKAIAGEAGVPFFSMSGSDFVEMFVGVGASRVRNLFDTAKKQAPCLIFIDEIDAVGRGRGRGFGNDEREQTLNQLLVEMDGFSTNEGIIIIAATNRADVLDEALLRPGRFDRQVHINLPDIKGREAIIAKYLSEIKALNTVDVASIARGTPGFSGAELANLVNEAALIAARNSRKLVSKSDFEQARDKILMGVERRTMSMTEQEIKNTAYHEAAHALCQTLLPNLDPVHKATIVPRGGALGMVQHLPERDKVSVNITEIRSQIAVAMAGRVAEEVFFGADNVTTGASSDIRHATRLARRAITEWGLDAKLGTVFYGETAPYYGDTDSRQNISDKTAELIDDQVKNMVKAGMALAQKTIAKNKAKLIHIAEALIKYETLTGEEIKTILSGKPLKIAELTEKDLPLFEKKHTIPISIVKKKEKKEDK